MAKRPPDGEFLEKAKALLARHQRVIDGMGRDAMEERAEVKKTIAHLQAALPGRVGISDEIGEIIDELKDL